MTQESWSHAAHHRRTSAARPVQRCLRIALCVPALLALATAAQGQSAEHRAFFDEFTADWVRARSGSRDGDALFLGRGAGSSRAPDDAEHARLAARAHRAARKGLTELRRIRPAKLSDSQRLSADLMQWQLDGVVRSERFLDYRFPLDQFGGRQRRSGGVADVAASARDSERRGQLSRTARSGRRAHGRSDRRGAAARRKNMIPPRFILETTLTQMRTFSDAAARAESAGGAFAEQLAAIESSRAERTQRTAGAGGAHRGGRSLSRLASRDRAARVAGAEVHRRCGSVALAGRGCGLCVRTRPLHDDRSHRGTDP